MSQSQWLQLLVKAVSPGSGCLEEKPQGNSPSPCVCGCVPVTALGFSLMTVAAWRSPIEDLVLRGRGLSTGCLPREKSNDSLGLSLPAKRGSIIHPSDLRWLYNRRDGAWRPVGSAPCGLSLAAKSI